MSRQNGYIVNIKAFVASPKDDFAKQAAAATLMAAVTSSNALTPEFLELATISEIKAKYGSVGE